MQVTRASGARWDSVPCPKRRDSKGSVWAWANPKRKEPWPPGGTLGSTVASGRMELCLQLCFKWCIYVYIYLFFCSRKLITYFYGTIFSNYFWEILMTMTLSAKNGSDQEIWSQLMICSLKEPQLLILRVNQRYPHNKRIFRKWLLILDFIVSNGSYFSIYLMQMDWMKKKYSNNFVQSLETTCIRSFSRDI